MTPNAGPSRRGRRLPRTGLRRRRRGFHVGRSRPGEGNVPAGRGNAQVGAHFPQQCQLNNRYASAVCRVAPNRSPRPTRTGGSSGQVQVSRAGGAWNVGGGAAAAPSVFAAPAPPPRRQSVGACGRTLQQFALRCDVATRCRSRRTTPGRDIERKGRCRRRLAGQGQLPGCAASLADAPPSSTEGGSACRRGSMTSTGTLPVTMRRKRAARCAVTRPKRLGHGRRCRHATLAFATYA